MDKKFDCFELKMFIYPSDFLVKNMIIYLQQYQPCHINNKFKNDIAKVFVTTVLDLNSSFQYLKITKNCYFLSIQKSYICNFTNSDTWSNKLNYSKHFLVMRFILSFS